MLNLKSQCGSRDHKFLAPRLVSNFKGAMSDDVRSMELNSSEYQVPDGVERLLAFIKRRLNIRELDLETEAFKTYFNDMMRRRGETLTKYINAEETAYRKLQRTLREAMEGGTDEYSEDEQYQPPGTKFKLPKRLRGWLFMERAQIPPKEHSGILNMTQGLNIDNLKRVMTESFPDKVLKDIDGRTQTKAPWQKNPSRRKPFNKNKKRSFLAQMADEQDDDEDEDEDDYDINAIDDDYDYEDDVWYEEGDDDDYDDEDADEDQVAYVDEEGWFYADEDTIHAVDEMLKFEDDEYAAILTTYTEARGALAKARLARGIYPVVVPADAGPQARFGRKGKPRPKGKGKGHGTPKGANAGPRPKGKPRPKGLSKSIPQWGRPDRPSGSQGNRPAPICFRCGKKRSLKRNLYQRSKREKSKRHRCCRCDY